MLTVSGIGLLLGIVLAIGIVRGVTGGIASVVRPMQALAAGDLEVAVPHQGRKTEIGTIADAVQVFKDGLIRMRRLEADAAEARLAAEEQRKAGMRQMADAFEGAVGSVIGQVSAAATELQATAASMSGAATETAGQSSTVAAAAEEAASNVNTVAAAAEELGSSVQEIGRNVSHAPTGTGEVTRTIAGVAGAAQETGAAASHVLASASELSRQSEHLSAEVDRFLATVRTV